MLVPRDDNSQTEICRREWFAEAAAQSWNVPTVFVIDDDDSVRESLHALISFVGWRALTFASADAFLERDRVEGPGCLLLDMKLSGINGLELQKRVAAERPDMPIIFMTGYRDVPMTVQAMKAGAFEFLTKPLSESVLLDAIRDAINYSIVARSDEMEHERLRSSYASLSRRERDIFELVVGGLSNKEVAAKLGISIITVKAHRGKVMQKMNATSLADLVKMETRLKRARALGTAARYSKTV